MQDLKVAADESANSSADQMLHLDVNVVATELLMATLKCI